MFTRCMGCMNVFEEKYQVCPHCGYLIGTKSEETIHMQPGSALTDRYVVGKVLGYGSFGTTYIGWDRKLQQKVAIKEYLPSEFSTRMPGRTSVTVFDGDKSEQFFSGLNKFIDESKRLAKFINEPGIVRIYDVIEANETAYIIMEYLDGETLSEHMAKHGLYTPEEAVSLLRPVMESLKVVHGAGLLHRDIAPDNIFITRDGQVKLIDFGASRYATTSHSRSLTVIVKQGYSPEEQYRSRGDQGTYTDVYALAATMYKMVTGETPPDAMERRAKYENKNKDILVPPHKLVKGLSHDFENALLNALNVRIEDRTEDVPAFIHEITAENPPVKRRYGKIKKIDIYTWPLWLKILIPTVACCLVVVGVLMLTGVIKLKGVSSDDLKMEGFVEVPGLYGLTEDEASGVMEGIPLNFVQQGTEVSFIYESEKKIVRQDQEPGNMLLKNEIVYYAFGINSEDVIDTEGEKIQLDGLVGLDSENAIDMLLEELKINKEQIITVEEPSDEVAAGVVLRCEPETISKNEAATCEIKLIVSSGSKAFQMPNVVGMNINEAKATLANLGLVVKEVKEVSTKSEGTVLKQSVKESSDVTRGATVTLTVAVSGEKTDNMVNVPNVVGESKETAIEYLSGAGFRYYINYIYVENSWDVGFVVDQSPSSGLAEKGSTIVIYVEKEKETEPAPQEITTVPEPVEEPVVEPITTTTAPKKEDPAPGSTDPVEIDEPTPVDTRVKVPQVVKMKRSTAEKELWALGLNVTPYEAYDSTTPKGSICKQNPDAGTLVEKGTYVEITVSLGIQMVTVYYNNNGTTTKRQYSPSLLIPLETPSARSGYTFTGWKTEDGKILKGTISSDKLPNQDEVTLTAQWEKKTELSDWVKKDQVPAGAEIDKGSTEWRYTERVYSESSKSSEPGKHLYKTEITDWGNEQGPVYSDPSNGTRSVRSEPYVADTVTHYKYYHTYGTNYQGQWVYGTDQTAPNATEAQHHRIDLTYPLSKGDNLTVQWYKGYSCPKCGTSTRWYPNGTYKEEIKKTRWYYKEPIYTYYYYEDVAKTSSTYPSGSNISDVQEWVRYYK